MENAPLFNEVADGPDDGAAWWIRAADGVRLRVGHWPQGDKGTVLLFPGRTEYIEKFGRAASDLQARGYGTLCIDWRGQGLADRLSDDPLLGHVERFADYQLDVAAMVKAATQLGCQAPFYLIGHSMGGCIGLRALHEGLDVRAAVFSGPMWGLAMAAHLRPLAGPMSWFMDTIGRGKTFAPGTKAETYVARAPFEDNQLTTDADMYAYMQRQAAAHPELTLGGPSLTWLHEALGETSALRRETPPDIPAITFLGGNERITDPRPIYEIMARWQCGHLKLVDGAEHEILMEKPDTRKLFFDEADALFSRRSG